MNTTDRKPLALRSTTAVFARRSAERGCWQIPLKCHGDVASQGEV
ncbi:hypothetical protein [Pandoraea norimbergensis]|nr:hypothetical protein [Pandoraea norimbergensis]